ncbi:DUF6708 domain-containing protein, partial [uncultured Cedecea sp.]|uniref:DUF6708 domain-containing protein n=1 Tax=uncultured Cedecea sp. TaxID=988762 RepID=UPI00261E671F
MGKTEQQLAKQAEHEAKHQPLRSCLNHPVGGWTEDLPEKAEDCSFPPQLIWVNELNDVWMELPRYMNLDRKGIWSPPFLLFIVPILMAFLIILPEEAFYTLSIFSFSFVIFLSLFSALYRIKSVLFEPQGAPVRFNRKRQKVYVYGFKKSFLPWRRWHPVIKEFDWKDIHGERVMIQTDADQGHRIYCAVCKPGTFDVVDRFILTWTVDGIDEAG